MIPPKNLQKSIKRDVSGTNGHRKHDFHEETIVIDTGETDFQCTGTKFMTFFQFWYWPGVDKRRNLTYSSF